MVYMQICQRWKGYNDLSPSPAVGDNTINCVTHNVRLDVKIRIFDKI